MKKWLKIIEDNYPALVLIILWSLYEYWLFFNHGLISSIIGIYSNSIKRPYLPFEETVQSRIHNCIFWAFAKTLGNHIPLFLLLLFMKYIAKCSPTFNKKAFKTLCIVTVVSLILVFCLRLYGDFWWVKVIQTKIPR
jgi:ammonia channel protein AmtB